MTNPQSPKKPESASLRSVLTARLRDRILRGELLPGERLIERELSKEFSVSRAVVRESLQDLHAERLIVRARYKGSFVASIQVEELESILAMRQIVEPYVVGLFTRNATDGDRDRCEKNLEGLRELHDAPDGDKLLLAYRQLDEIIMDGCGNAVASEIFALLKNRCLSQIRTILGSYKSQASVLREIEAISEAILAGKPELAASRVSHHIMAEHLRIVLRQGRSSEVAEDIEEQENGLDSSLESVVFEGDTQSDAANSSILSSSSLSGQSLGLPRADLQRHSVDRGSVATNTPSAPETLYRNTFVSHLSHNAVEAYKAVETLGDDNHENEDELDDLTFGEILQRSWNFTGGSARLSLDDIDLPSDDSRPAKLLPPIATETNAGKKRKFFSRPFSSKK